MISRLKCAQARTSEGSGGGPRAGLGSAAAWAGAQLCRLSGFLVLKDINNTAITCGARSCVRTYVHLYPLVAGFWPGWGAGIDNLMQGVKPSRVCVCDCVRVGVRV